MRQTVSTLLLLATLPSFWGCGGGEAPTEEEHPSVVVTQWNDSTELFLEYPHLLAGQPTGNWAIHLSDMTTFKPITAGTLTVRFLRNGQEARSFSVEAPARDGIFLLDPVIDEPGTYQVQLALSSSQATSVHTLPAVQVWASEAELPREESDEGGGIAFLKEQQWQIPFAVRSAREQQVSRTVSAPGEIVAPDGALAQVSAPTSGIALAASNRGAPSVGQAVSAGELLVVLNPIAGEGGYARARGELERLEQEVDRAERLFAAGAIPQKRLDDARRELEVARAEVRSLGGGAEEGDFRLRVRAPISGTVAARSFVPGGRVQAGDPLFTIVDPATLWLRVQLPPGAASSLSRDAIASFAVDGVSRTFEASRLVSVGSVLDPATRTVPAVFAVQNPGGGLKIGQYARVTVPVGGTVTGVAIPNEAIIDDNGTPVAYVQTGGESFERRVLTLGESDATYSQVVQGISAEEKVVTTGAYQVRLASMSGSDFAGGHAH
jgi:cobalt-zinc-cadmium efflux system membrane fusion protein